VKLPPAALLEMRARVLLAAAGRSVRKTRRGDRNPAPENDTIRHAKLLEPASPQGLELCRQKCDLAIGR
jgi:hypothetical protein